jgi:hypothetical protein
MHVDHVQCPCCKSDIFLRAVAAEPSPVTGVGHSDKPRIGTAPTLDLGLAILLEAQT